MYNGVSKMCVYERVRVYAYISVHVLHGVCAYVCMHVRVCMWCMVYGVFRCVCVCMSVHVLYGVYRCVYAYAYVYVMCACMCVCMCYYGVPRMCACMGVYIYVLHVDVHVLWCIGYLKGVYKKILMLCPPLCHYTYSFII